MNYKTPDQVVTGHHDLSEAIVLTQTKPTALDDGLHPFASAPKGARNLTTPSPIPYAL